jgi:acetolactate synthase-1/2/3 large subunit
MATIVPIPTIRRAQYGSDVIVDLLRALDIDHVSLNPGASFRGLHDSLFNYGGNTHPEMILCNHENIAVSLATGYGQAAGRPMAAIVHNVVGLLNATNAIYNSWLIQAPILILGGTGPMAVERRRPWIDWIHTALVQGNAVRDFVKWDDQPNSVPSAIDAVLRGYRMAMTEPKGPVYICLDTPIQEDPLTQPISLPEVAHFAPPTPAYPDPQALNQAAQMLVSAQHPVVLVDSLEQEKDIATLTELAEMLSLPVVDQHSAMSFPNTHPLNLTGVADEALAQTDLVLALNVPYLFRALSTVDRTTRLASYRIPTTARIVEVSLHHLNWRSWSQAYGRLQATDLSITANAGYALPALVEQCRQLLAGQPGQQARLQERYVHIQASHDAARQRWQQEAERGWQDTPVSLPRLASELWQVIKDEDC